MNVSYTNSQFNRTHAHTVRLDLSAVEFVYPVEGMARAGWLDLADGPAGYPQVCWLRAGEVDIEGAVLFLRGQVVVLGFKTPAEALAARLLGVLTGTLVGSCEITTFPAPLGTDQTGLEPALV